MAKWPQQLYNSHEAPGFLSVYVYIHGTVYVAVKAKCFIALSHLLRPSAHNNYETTAKHVAISLVHACIYGVFVYAAVRAKCFIVV